MDTAGRLKTGIPFTGFLLVFPGELKIIFTSVSHDFNGSPVFNLYLLLSK